MKTILAILITGFSFSAFAQNAISTQSLTLAQAGALVAQVLANGQYEKQLAYNGATKTAYGYGHALPVGAACELSVYVAKTGAFTVGADNRGNGAGDSGGAYTFVNIADAGQKLVSLVNGKYSAKDEVIRVLDANKLHLVAHMAYPRQAAEDGTNQPSYGTESLIVTQDNDVIVQSASHQVYDCQVK